MRNRAIAREAERKSIKERFKELRRAGVPRKMSKIIAKGGIYDQNPNDSGNAGRGETGNADAGQSGQAEQVGTGADPKVQDPESVRPA